MTRSATVPLGWLAAGFTIAQVADLATALVVARELNPVVAAVVDQPLLGLALKLALIGFVVAVAAICAGPRPDLARLVLVVGILAGLAGALGNTHLTPFLAA